MSFKSRSGKELSESDIFTKDNILNAYVISDTHFFHHNIIRYCDRPWCKNPKTHSDEWCPYCDVNKMNEDIINNWNNSVPKDGIILHLGDFAFLSNRTGVTKDDIKNLSSRLNGKIYLIKGNHDRKGKKWFDDIGINLIKDFFVRLNKKTFIFSHRPFEVCSKDVIPVFGHWHNKAPFTWIGENGKVYFNVSVDVINFRPIRLSTIFNLYEDLQLGEILI